MPPVYPTEQPGKARLLLAVLSGLSITLLLGALLWFESQNAPHLDFPVGVDIEIAEGLTQNEITNLLAEKHVVRSALYLYLHLARTHEGEFVKAGTYRFGEPLTTEEVARSLTRGENRSPLLRFTLPEGFHAGELSRYLPEELGITDTTDLRTKEGYLFPDTYFVSQEATLDDIVVMLETTFQERIQPLREKIDASPFTEAEVITLASIIEREANDPESKRLVSGILQNRLDIGMPLQVDAVFDYLLGKTSAELTEDDLDFNSPYNTYRYAGLPPGPIANPGLESIAAVLEPADTSYLYYLTGNDGKFYYAKTFEEHKRNKERYLR